jgi:beta-glucosidase/6-phospho-beta-glucosidase/beta-galactosidase
MLRRSELQRVYAPDYFEWLSGIEDTFITAPSPKTGRHLDEYELTEHYTRWRGDVKLLAELGVRSVRYGIPWHRIHPSRDRWEFRWADEPLEALLDAGISPIVDLIHYGTPGWLDGAFTHPDYADHAAEYATRIAERFRGRIHAYTPLNEPRVTAWYCGRIGWWPPFLRSWGGFLRVMLGVCRGIVQSSRALRGVDPEIILAHVDATDLYEATHPSLLAEANRRQELVFLALDLVSGRVHSGHPLLPWLLEHGMTEADVDFFAQSAVDLDLVGINLYPLFSEKRLVRTAGGLRARMRYADARIIDRLAELYWTRYQRPLFISETASEGSVARRAAWLTDSVAAVRRVRARGIPLIGYTWWPLFALVTWGYREGQKPPHAYLKQMGLWDLRPAPSGLERDRTPLVEQYQKLVRQGGAPAGRLAIC